MADIVTTRVMQGVRHAGFRIIRMEHVRANRWIIQASNQDGQPVVILAVDRSLVAASDIQDLEEIIRLRHAACGVLWSLRGRFSAYAQQAQRDSQLQLILANELPNADQCGTRPSP